MRYITDYQIRTVEGQILVGLARRMDILVDHIRAHGLLSIAKISFYFRDDDQPDAFFNVVVRQHSGVFVPEAVSRQDWALVMKVLEYGNLDDMFVAHILQPFREGQPTHESA